MSGSLSPYGWDDFRPDQDTIDARNAQWAKPGTYNTPLQFNEETRFRQWAQQNQVPINPDAKSSDYDMRGFWRALQSGDPRATSAIDPNDSRLHYPDHWKTPGHETFSNQSQWATPDAPRWTPDDKLIDRNGTVLFDDRANSPSINPATGLPQFNLADAQAGNRMSGSMMPPGMPPMGGPPMGGAPPGMGGPPGMGPPPGGPPGMGANNGVPQLPPQVIQMLMQALQQGGGQGGPPGMQQPPQGPPPALPHPGMQQMAAQGQNGDTLVAHMTPGEIAVPPQVQTPQLMQVLRAAFAQMGINPAQFTAGAPQAARNPSTGAPEFSIWSSILPILGGVAGMALAPYTGGLSVPAGAAIGGGLGGAAGGAIDGQSAAGIALSGLGGAAGGYMGAPAGGAGAALAPAASGLGADAVTNAAASNALASGAAPAMNASMSAAPNVFSAGAQAAPGIMGGAAGGAAGQSGNFLSSTMPYIKTGLAAGTGAGVGGMLAPPPTTDPLDKAGFNRKLGPINPNFNQVRGSGQTSTPNFTGYNPYATVAGPNPGFSFFPQQ